MFTAPRIHILATTPLQKHIFKEANVIRTIGEVGHVVEEVEHSAVEENFHL